MGVRVPKETKKAAKEYDVAISFAGEDRRLAEALAKALKQSGIKVFYDKNERSTLWGKDLFQHLSTVYRDRARYCVVLVSKVYVKKDWTRHELKNAQERAFRQRKEYILPIQLDKTKLPGLNTTTGYIDASVTTVSEIVHLIGEKLGIETADVSKALRKTWDKEFVVYQGARMTSYWPIMIEDAQKQPNLTFVSTRSRIRYSKEKRYGKGRLPKNCHDCGVVHGQLHVLGCDMEECANCGEQLISCGCKTTTDDTALTDF
jgi:TIR domain-containing protein